MARGMIREETRVQLRKDEIYAYVSRAALGLEPLPEVLGTGASAAVLPVLITGSMLFLLRPRGMEWWEYLDQIWHATEIAENLDESVPPAVQVRMHRTALLEARRAAGT